MVIGFTGKAGSGKDTAAMMVESIVYAHNGTSGWTNIRRFSGPLKEIVGSATGVAPASMNLQHIKDMEIGGSWGGMTIREMLVKVGLGVRSEIPDFWVNYTIDGILRDTTSPNMLFLVPDVRFLNEAEAIRRIGGKIIRITRAGLPVGDNLSETEMDLIKPDVEIFNDGDKADMHQPLLRILYDWKIILPHQSM